MFSSGEIRGQNSPCDFVFATSGIKQKRENEGYSLTGIPAKNLYFEIAFFSDQQQVKATYLCGLLPLPQDKEAIPATALLTPEASQAATLRITIEAPSNVGLPPALPLFHDGTNNFFNTGSTASAGLEALAEVEDTSNLQSSLATGDNQLRPLHSTEQRFRYILHC